MRRTGTSLPVRLARNVPLARLLIAAQVAITVGRQLARLDAGERRRLVELMGEGVRRRGKLSAGEREELRAIVVKLEPHLLLASAVQRLSPVPVPRRLLTAGISAAAKSRRAR
jgi:hypothetical protein